MERSQSASPEWRCYVLRVLRCVVQVFMNVRTVALTTDEGKVNFFHFEDVMEGGMALLTLPVHECKVLSLPLLPRLCVSGSLLTWHRFLCLLLDSWFGPRGREGYEILIPSIDGSSRASYGVRRRAELWNCVQDTLGGHLKQRAKDVTAVMDLDTLQSSTRLNEVGSITTRVFQSPQYLPSCLPYGYLPHLISFDTWLPT
ncbi:hypothetical protein WAI453_004723 [Rhynchosporium graminicola]